MTKFESLIEFCKREIKAWYQLVLDYNQVHIREKLFLDRQNAQI